MTTLTRWNPWQEIDSLQRQMNRMVEDTLAPVAGQVNGLTRFAPAVEMTDTEDTVQIKLELPGIDPNDVNIEVTDRSVSISGERKSEQTSTAEGTTRSEFYYGSFRRIIPLSTRVQNTDAKADYQDGILQLTLPKATKERNKVVKIEIHR